MKELSQMPEINDVQCETTDSVFFVLQQCEIGKFFITIENKNPPVLCVSLLFPHLPVTPNTSGFYRFKKGGGLHVHA